MACKNIRAGVTRHRGFFERRQNRGDIWQKTERSGSETPLMNEPASRCFHQKHEENRERRCSQKHVKITATTATPSAGTVLHGVSCGTETFIRSPAAPTAARTSRTGMTMARSPVLTEDRRNMHRLAALHGRIATSGKGRSRGFDSDADIAARGLMRWRTPAAAGIRHGGASA